MRISWRSIVGCSLPVAWLFACGGGSDTSSDVRDAGSSADVTVSGRDAAPSDGDVDSDATVDGGDASEGAGDAASDVAVPEDGGPADGGPAEGGDTRPCQGGFYNGSFEGLYSSGIINVFLRGPDAGTAVNLPMVGDTKMTLEPMGSAQQVCMLAGQSDDCSQVFSIADGTVAGTIDGLFPFYCKVTGTLGCREKKLVDGWMSCVYCVISSVVDGGTACTINTSVSQGRFAGTLTADYLYGVGDDGGSPSFGTAPLPSILDGTIRDAGGDPGAWNGSESLAGYSGSGPLPDGGYLSDAGYGRLGVAHDYGGFGFWNVTYQHP